MTKGKPGRPRKLDEVFFEGVPEPLDPPVQLPELPEPSVELPEPLDPPVRVPEFLELPELPEPSVELPEPLDPPVQLPELPEPSFEGLPQRTINEILAGRQALEKFKK